MAVDADSEDFGRVQYKLLDGDTSMRINSNTGKEKIFEDFTVCQKNYLILSFLFDNLNFGFLLKYVTFWKNTKNLTINIKNAEFFFVTL